MEHAFGLLKGHFPTLQQIEGVNLDSVHAAIEALMVIHNILIVIGDDPKDIEDFNGQEDWEVNFRKDDDVAENQWVLEAQNGRREIRDADELYLLRLARWK